MFTERRQKEAFPTRPARVLDWKHHPYGLPVLVSGAGILRLPEAHGELWRVRDPKRRSNPSRQYIIRVIAVHVTILALLTY